MKLLFKFWVKNRISIWNCHKRNDNSAKVLSKKVGKLINMTFSKMKGQTRILVILNQTQRKFWNKKLFNRCLSKKTSRKILFKLYINIHHDHHRFKPNCKLTQFQNFRIMKGCPCLSTPQTQFLNDSNIQIQALLTHWLKHQTLHKLLAKRFWIYFQASSNTLLT